MAPSEIRPFRLEIPQEQLDDLARRLDATRWPTDGPVSEWSQGVPLDYARALAHYWRSDYDWRAQEARLNRYPQFLTSIFDHDVHFLHVRSEEPDALPLVLTHGWPGSIVEFLDVIDPLTDPAAYGGDRADAFHVVVPTVPGFGIPGPTTSEWTTRRVAEAWALLMDRLGYGRYAAHGGDFGSVISRHLGLVDREHVVALHLTALLSSSARDDSDDPEQQASLAKAQRYRRELSGYARLQSTRPQSLAYALTDSRRRVTTWPAPGSGALRRRGPLRQPLSRSCRPTSPDLCVGSPRRPTTSSAGGSCPAAATSPRWNSPSSSSPTSARRYARTVSSSAVSDCCR